MINPKQHNPIALLMIYDPSFKFKNSKYYLKKGSNLIGCHHDCQVMIEDNISKIIPQKAANLYITDDLSTIQALVPKSVYTASNMINKNTVMVELEVGVKYVIQMEKDFILCGRKTLMQVLPLQQLLQIKGIANQNMFRINNNNNNNQNVNNRQKQIHDNTNKQFNNLFQPTLLLQPNDNNFQPTLLIPNTHANYEPTQRIEDQIEFQPTIPIDDYDFIPQSYRRQQMNIKRTQSKQQLMKNHKKPSSSSSISNEQKQQINQISKIVVSQRQISMPETIREEDEMPATILDQNQVQHTKSDVIVQAPQSIRDDFVFPPTIEQIKQEKNQQIITEIKNKLGHMTKSSPIYRQVKNQKMVRNVCSYGAVQQNKNILDSIDSLFEDTNQPYNKWNQPKLRMEKKQIRNTTISNKNEQSEGMQKKQKGIFGNYLKKKQKIQQQRNEQSEARKTKKCYIIGKINKNQLQRLSKKSYNVISSYDDPDFPHVQLILIEGQVQANKIILISLLRGKEFKPINWIANENAELSGKLEGFLWSQILKRKGRGKQILDTNKNYYLQQQLRQQYEEVMNAAGAKLMEKIGKNKSKMTIYLIIDEKSKAGHDTFEQWKNYKNWSFYSKKMIIESILMGEEILDKYKLDSYSF